MFKFCIFLITYLITSISPAIIICRIKKGEDIREVGSGNAGTTNAIRVLGKGMGILVFILDVLKVLIAYLSIHILAKIFSYTDFITLNSIFIVASVVGHCYPIYYSFKGGKGVAVLLSSVFVINYKIALVCLIFGLILIIITKVVSVGSLCGLLLFDIMTFVMMPEYILPVLAVSLIVFIKHRKNITRILNKQENKLF